MRFTALGVIMVALAGFIPACSESSSRDSGQTGSVGPSVDECRVASDCDERLQDELAQFSAPTSNTKRFESAECTQAGVAGGLVGAACVCRFADSAGSGSLNIGPAGLGCYAYGRGGDCLWQGDDFEGCDVDDAASCDAVCDELEQRLDDDAARTFQASGVFAVCEEQACRTVIELDDRCFADKSYLRGRAYDCALGGQAILDAERAAQQPPPQDVRPEDRSSYVEGTDGFVTLAVAKSYTGTQASPLEFGAFAQFVQPGSGGVSYGEIIDPLEGADDCGVFKSSGVGAGGPVAFHDAAEVMLLDAGQSRPLAESSSSNAGFYSYSLELDPARVEPRYDARYGVHVSGGTFGATFDSVDGLRLPEALEIPELTNTAHVEQADLSLTWSGRGADPLYLFMIVNKNLDGFFETTELRCLMNDDGAFIIPASVLQAMPTGFASATVERADRRIVKSGPRSLLLQGSVQLSYRFAFGPRCESSPAFDACLASAEPISAAYEECGLTPPSLAELCPEILATSCHACPEYFECAQKETRCTAEGFFTPVGCSCPG